MLGYKAYIYIYIYIYIAIPLSFFGSQKECLHKPTPLTHSSIV